MKLESLNVLLIEDSPDYAELVAQWLSSAPDDESFRLSWTDSLALGLNRLADEDVDVVLLDLGLPDSDGLPTFLAVRDRAPGIPIIVLSAVDSEPLALRMIQGGAEDYLVKRSCSADRLTRAVRYARVRHQAQLNKLNGDPGAPRVVGVLGAKGGVGATTLACNLAAELHRQTAEKVLLADLDIQAGSVAFQMGIEPKYSVLDAVNNIDHLDLSCWEGIVTQKDTDLPILSSPALLGAPEPDVSDIGRLIALARSFYRWVVLDFGRINCFSRSVANSVDELLVVTTPGIPALYESKRMLDGLVQAGFPRDQIRLIVNQAEESKSWPERDLTQMFGIQVHASLPSASDDLHDAYIGRRLPGENTKIRREIARLARRVAGLPEPQTKRGIAQFLPFRERTRKSDESRRRVLTS
jgi:pilus assembly protein CpaE